MINAIKVVGIGIDAVEIVRFQKFAAYNKKSLRRIFSDDEIDYALSEPIKSAERFAARFAVKEALYKALHNTATSEKLSFFPVCSASSYISKPIPTLCVDWQKIGCAEQFQVFVSVTHTNTTAFAQVILQSF